MSSETRTMTINSAALARRPFFQRAAILAALSLVAARASAETDAALSAKAIAWASKNIEAYKQYHSFAQHRQHPQVPVPPMVDPPCHLCGDTAQTQGEQQVAAWVAQSEEPENTYIKGLLAMDKQIQLFGAPNSHSLTPAAQKALGQFEDDAGFLSDAAAIAAELVNEKAVPMAQKYAKEPKQAYAGIAFLLAANKEQQLLGKDQDHSVENESIQMAERWEQSISDKIANDVLAGHKYNLCPVYSEIVRSVTLLGGEEPADMAKYVEMLKKLQDLVKFNVNVTLKVMIDTADGSHMHATWTGKSKLTLQLDLGNSCYTPQFDNGAKMAVNVTGWDMVTMEKQSNGTETPIPVRLSSPHSYDVALSKPQLNLCDPQPIFQMPAPDLSTVNEEVTAKGHTTKTALFGPFLSSVIAANEINSKPSNAVTGQAPSLPGGSPARSSSSSGSGNAALDSDKQLIESHKGDVNWLMSAAGQAAIADMQKQALATAQSRMAAAGVVVPNATTFTQLSESLSSAHLPWTNGQAQPVNKTLHVKKDTSDITLTVSVQQAQ